MKNFECAYLALQKTVIENLPFNIAVNYSIKSANKQSDKNFRAVVSSLTGCTLRHYYVFNEIITANYHDIEDNVKILICLGLANHLFAKKVDDDELISFIKEESHIDNVGDFIKNHSDNSKLIPEEIEYGTKKFFSLRYNIPYWVVNMWEKNCGPFLSRKVFRSLSSKTSDKYLRINNSVLSDEEFFTKYSNLETYLHDGFAICNDKESDDKRRALRHNDAFNIPLGYKYMCDQIDFDMLRGIAIFSGCNNYLLKELFARFGKSLSLECMCDNEKIYFDIDQFRKKYNLNKIGAYQCTHTGLITCLSNKVHTLFVCPNNSNFNSLIERPDYFLYCKQDELDSYIQYEKETLDASIDVVEDGGDIIYFVPTICRNETSKLIRNFVKEHPNMKIVLEKQLFPFDEYQSMLYFVILRKEANDD